MARRTRNNLASIQNIITSRKQLHDPKVKKGLKVQINKQKSLQFQSLVEITSHWNL